MDDATAPADDDLSALLAPENPAEPARRPRPTGPAGRPAGGAPRPTRPAADPAGPPPPAESPRPAAPPRVEPVPLVEPVRPVEPVGLVEPVRLVEPLPLVEPVRLVEPVGLVEWVVPAPSTAVGVGGRFQPVSDAWAAVAADAGGWRLTTVAGAAVHAVEDGTVHLPRTDGEPVVLRGQSGLTFAYDGLVVDRVRDGDRVAPGAPLGTVAGARPGAAAGPEPGLVLRIRDAAGEPVDAGAFLVGLPDPDELGRPAGAGQGGIDPDPLDREIVRTVAAPDWWDRP